MFPHLLCVCVCLFFFLTFSCVSMVCVCLCVYVCMCAYVCSVYVDTGDEGIIPSQLSTYLVQLGKLSHSDWYDSICYLALEYVLSPCFHSRISEGLQITPSVYTGHLQGLWGPNTNPQSWVASILTPEQSPSLQFCHFDIAAILDSPAAPWLARHHTKTQSCFDTLRLYAKLKANKHTYE